MTNSAILSTCTSCRPLVTIRQEKFVGNWWISWIWSIHEIFSHELPCKNQYNLFQIHEIYCHEYYKYGNIEFQGNHEITTHEIFLLTRNTIWYGKKRGYPAQSGCGYRAWHGVCVVQCVRGCENVIVEVGTEFRGIIGGVTTLRPFQPLY